MNLFSLGKNKKLVIEKLKKFAEKSSFKFKLDGLYKINEDKKQKYNILKSVYFTYPMAYYSFLDFVKDLNKSGAKVELVNPYYKAFEEYEEEKLKAFQKELNLIKKQKNKKKGLGDVIKCQVENGIYNVYHTVIKSEADEYDSSSDQQISSAVLVINKEI